MSNDKAMFVTWDENDPASKEKAFAKANHADSLSRSIAGNSFQNVATNHVSVRESFDRRDYDFFRPGEQIPLFDKDIMLACMQAYERIGIVRNVIDMMAEFACQGIELVHPNEKIQDFYREWFKKVNGLERTERILNMLYRAGNVIIKRSTAKLKNSEVENLQKGSAADLVVEKPVAVAKNEIPWSYTIYNPCTIEVYGEELAPFLGPSSFRYGVRIPEIIAKKLKNPKEEIEKEMLSGLPTSNFNSSIAGGKSIPLPADKTVAIYYKRDDWQVWAKPMIYCILEDLLMLKKMKLADLAALDGAVSHIRLWKLGSLEHRILPTENAIGRLADMLLNNVGGGSIDLIWGPELDFKETSTDVAKFLGEEKYKPILNAIFAGLGIPPSLTGLPTGQGFSNNYISLRTLIERLDYGRQLLTRFWETEIKVVQKAMGFKFPAQVVFDHQTLQDEAAEKRLLIDLVDRDIISEEAIQERFNFVPEIESVRRKRELKKRENDQMPKKAGPWHNPQRLEEIKKLWAQMGVLTPKDFGVEASQETAPPKVPPMGQNPNQSQDKPIGIEGQGRPVGIKDQEVRKKKEIKPRTAAELVEIMSWAEAAQKSISDLVNPAFLHSSKKKSIRELSSEDFNSLEKTKFHILCNLSYLEKVERQTIAKIINTDMKIHDDINKVLSIATKNYISKEGIQPNTETRRKIEASSVAIYFIGKQDETNNSDYPIS
jgi:hypothetical protein